MYSNIKFYYLIFFVSFSASTYSQITKLPDYSIETGAAVSSGRQTSFWLMSNQYGLITQYKYNWWIRLELKTTLSTEKNFDYDYGLEVIDRHNNKNKLYLNQAYLRLKFYFFNFQVGSIKETFGNQDSSLSSGGLLWSGNARPMPKVSIVVPKYTPVPFTRGYLEFKGGISHGWFGNNQFVKNSWLHHKYLYLQIGGKLPVHFHYGLHHYAQWGGQSADSTIGQLPQSFDDFIKIFFTKAGDETSPYADQIYVLGNHLISRNFGLDLEFTRVKINIYWQTIIEDKSGWYWANNKDGLWGIHFHLKEKNHLINGIGYEFINTTDQSGLHMAYWLLNGKRYYTPVNGGVI
ncbi:MAG: capsule assembly Wzi family protein, partial [Bacteroidales bacterium]